MKKWFLVFGAPMAMLILFCLLLTLFVQALFHAGGYDSGASRAGNMAVVQAAQAMAPYLYAGPPDNYDVRYDTQANIMQQAITYWSKLCPGCQDWQNGNLQCTMFVAAAFALANQPLPQTNLNAIDYWSAYRNQPGWMEIASGTGMPVDGDIVIWSSPFFGGVGHMAVVVNVVASPDGKHDGSLTFAEGNGPGALVTFPLQPDLQLVGWSHYMTMGYIRNLKYAYIAGTASQNLRRIPQLDCQQYASQQECNIWAYAACSAASMTEVVDAYGADYRISDVLQVEARRGAITPQLGLVSAGGIADTMAHFGFSTRWGLDGYSLEQVVQTAEAGTPVMVGFPPDRYAGGHILVVRGGQIDPASGQVIDVFVADSSSWNRTVIDRAQFLAWWSGFYVVAVPLATGPGFASSPIPSDTVSKEHAYL